MAPHNHVPRGPASSAQRRSSARGVAEDCTQLPFPKPKYAERADCSWHSQQQRQLWLQQQKEQQVQLLCQQNWQDHGNRQPRVVRADNSWVSQHPNQSRELDGYGLLRAAAFREQLAQRWASHANQSRDFAGYGLLRAEAFQEQLAQRGRKASEAKWRPHLIMDFNSQQKGVAAAEGVELQPIGKENRTEQHKKHQRPGIAAVERSGVQPKRKEDDQKHLASQFLVKEQHKRHKRPGMGADERSGVQPKKKEDQKHLASQLLVRDQAQQAQQTGPSDQSQMLPQATLSQNNAGRQDSRVPTTAAQMKEEDPKLFDMTVNDYDNYETDFFPASSARLKENKPKLFDMTLNDHDKYETDFFPASSDMTTDDSGCSLSHRQEGEEEP